MMARAIPAVWPRADRSAIGATLFAAVPSLYRQILKYADLPALRSLAPAPRAAPPASPCRRTSSTLGRRPLGKPLYEALGMSEVSTYVSSGPTTPAAAPAPPASPQPGRRVAILPVAKDAPEPLPAGETGLLAVHRSEPGLMLGYWNRPDEEAAGDARRVVRWRRHRPLRRGRLPVWFEGRNDDLMNAMGYRVSPVEVEGALLARHPRRRRGRRGGAVGARRRVGWSAASSC